MKNLSKAGKIFLCGAVFAALIFVVSLSMFITSIVIANSESDVGYDLTGRDVVKMELFGEDGRIAGTQQGELFAFDAEGNLLWDLGQLRESAVYEIAYHEGTVYAVYADGYVLSFKEADARAYCNEAGSAAVSAEGEAVEAALLEAPIEAPEDVAAPEEAAVPAEASDGEAVEAAPLEEEKPPFSEVYSVRQWQMDYAISGGVRGTQLLVGEDALYLRANFNDGRNRNYIFRFSEEEETPVSVLGRGSAFTVGGMAIHDGTFYYVYRGQLRTEQGTVCDLEEDIVALSACEEGLSMITLGGNLAVYDVSAGEITFNEHLSVELDTGFVFSTGENFLAKVKNGGVARIDTQARDVTIKISARNSANFILWDESGFMLRDTSDVNHPVLSFYTTEQAETVQLYSILLWVFFAIMLVSLAVGAVLAVCVVDRLRAKLKKEAIATLKAIWRDKTIYIALLIPFALLIIFYYVPIVLGFAISFMDYVPGERAVFEGFKYFIEVVRNPDFWSAAGTMLLFLVTDLLKALIPPFIIAELLIAVKLKRFSLWIRILLFLPGILPGVATTLVWMQGIFGNSQYGLLNAFIKLFAPSFVTQNWLQSSYAVRVLTIVCFGFPWVGSYLIFFGALGGINTSIFEAAKLDGCSWIRRIFSLDIPLILSQFKYVIITTFIASVQNYGTLYIIYGTGSRDTLQTPALMMYGSIMEGHYNTASVMGVFLFLFLAVVTVLNFRSQREQID